MYPFDMPAGEYWVGIYLGMAATAFAAGELAVRWLVNREPPKAPPEIYNPLDPRRFYRVAPAPAATHKRFTVGHIPAHDEHLAIAFLRGGTRAVAETLLGSAVAGGWLFLQDERYQRSERPAPRGTLLGMFVEGVASGSSDAHFVVDAARRCADSFVPELEAELKRAQLLPSDAAVTQVRLLRYGAVATVLGLGILRLVERPAAQPPLFLLLAVACAVVFGLLRMKAPLPQTRAAKEYQRWLMAATTSLQRDVGAGRRTADEEVALAVAVAGLGVVAPLPAYGALSSPLELAYTPVAPAGSGGGCSSGSSCGGGGGCGGGCGGGGCS